MPQTAGGRWYNAPEVAPRAALASAARTAGGQSSAFNSEDAASLDVTLTISAVSGTTPTLDLKVQTSHDGTTWDDVAAFPQKTGVNTHKKTFGPLGPLCRYSWAIGGTATPTFTFKVDAVADVQP